MADRADDPNAQSPIRHDPAQLAFSRKRPPNTWGEAVALAKSEDERTAARNLKRRQLQERRRQVAQLWFGGYEVNEIARHLRLDYRLVRLALDRELADIGKLGDDPRTVAHREKVRILGMTAGLLRTWYPRARGIPATATTPAIEPDPRAAELILKIAERRERLTGASEPARFEHAGPDGGAIPVDVNVHAQVEQLRTAVFQVIEHDPTRRDAVVEALRAAERGDAPPTNGHAAAASA